VEVVVEHTGALEPAVLADARALLEQVFDGELTPEDWQHCLGGMHALARGDDGDLLAHAALVQRRLVHQGRILRAGYVEGVGVRADARRRGLGGAVMAPLEELGRRAFDVVALAASDEALAFYGSRGWHLWRGPTSALTPEGVVRTPDDDDCVFVLDPVGLDLSGELTCDWREGDLW
jgi:aminoglycoside 2'-N-acetyltransferase I